MTSLRENIEQMLQRLIENSSGELEIVRELADGIRKVDDQMLLEVRNVALQHEVRREAIFGELQELASRLCVLPSRNVINGVSARGYVRAHSAIEGRSGGAGSTGGDWRQAAQKIDEELSEILNAEAPRH
jgi:hypothetical protein